MPEMLWKVSGPILAWREREWEPEDKRVGERPELVNPKMLRN